MTRKKIVIFGGGTVSHVRNHFSICAPAYGKTARQLAYLSAEILPEMDVDLQLTKMGGGDKLETNEDIDRAIDKYLQDDTTKVIIMSAALCDYDAVAVYDNPKEYGAPDQSNIIISAEVQRQGCSKNAIRLQTSEGNKLLKLSPADKIIDRIRKTRKDIFLVGFKASCNKIAAEQYILGLNLCKKASCNLVFANDTGTRLNMVITPEESRYHETTNRIDALRGLLEMVFYRTHLTFTRSTVVDGQPIPWSSELIPDSLRTVVNHCIQQNAYRPLNGVTAGHFAYKLNDNTFLTSIRKTNFNKLNEVGLVKIVTDGPDTVLAYGAKPSVGGQSQRIVFNDHPGMDCIVHFHCVKKESSKVPVVSQREFECGSHSCGKNTSDGLKQFGNLKAVYLDNHGPNIVFNHSIDPQEVIKFIEENFDLATKTGGFVSLDDVHFCQVKPNEEIAG